MPRWGILFEAWKGEISGIKPGILVRFQASLIRFRRSGPIPAISSNRGENCLMIVKFACQIFLPVLVRKATTSTAVVDAESPRGKIDEGPLAGHEVVDLQLGIHAAIALAFPEARLRIEQGFGTGRLRHGEDVVFEGPFMFEGDSGEVDHGLPMNCICHANGKGWQSFAVPPSGAVPPPVSKVRVLRRLIQAPFLFPIYLRVFRVGR